MHMYVHLIQYSVLGAKISCYSPFKYTYVYVYSTHRFICTWECTSNSRWC